VAARLLQVVVFPYRGCSFTATTRVQIETKNGFDLADEQARAKAAGAGHTASWKTGSKHVRRCQRNRRDLFSSPMIFLNSNDANGHASKKGNATAITIPVGSNQGHYVTLCAAQVH
jgi:hypothetical protein